MPAIDLDKREAAKVMQDEIDLFSRKLQRFSEVMEETYNLRIRVEKKRQI